MHEILQQLRKNKGITQEELARILAISKGAVSKWETGKSLPDIGLLPAIASYYDCSIDKLFDTTKPSKESISQSYKDWGIAFSQEGFEPVFKQIQLTSLNYLTESSMLLSNVLVVINHLQIAVTPEDMTEATRWCLSYLEIVQTKATNAQDIIKAAMLKATCHLALGEASSVITEFGDDDPYIFVTQPILAQALAMSGEIVEAKQLLQKVAYQFLLMLYSSLEQLAFYEEDKQRFMTIQQKVKQLVELFEIKTFHPGLLLKGFLDSSLVYLKFAEVSLALDELEDYTTTIIESTYPFKLVGNDLFDDINPWLASLNEGSSLPVNDRILANQLVEVVSSDQYRSQLNGEQRYMDLINRLKEWRDHYVNG